MFKHGCMALVAIACVAAVPAARAEGNFFIAGQVGQARYNDVGLNDDTASTRAISAGYRWQAGPVVQVGIEGGYGWVDEVRDTYVQGFSSIGMEADYAHLGANARFRLGEGSRWFAIARLGYMGYTQDVSYQSSPPGSPSVSYSYSDDGGGAYFGGGIGVDVSRSLNINVMVNGYVYSDFEDGEWDEDYGTATTLTLGLELRY